MLQRITKRDLWPIIMGSFLIQGSWSYRYMLALGFCFSALPICRKFFRDQQQQEAFIRRHLEFFNSHPYFTCYCLGVTARLEEDALLKKFVDYESISKFKLRLGSATGAIGDRLFWSLLKPIAASIGMILAGLGAIVAVPLFLLTFNIPHLVYRMRGVLRGYKFGFDVINEISRRKYKRIFNWLSMVGTGSTGIVISVSAAYVYRGGVSNISFSGGTVGLIAFLLSIPIALVLLRLRFSISTILLVSIGISSGVGVILSL